MINTRRVRATSSSYARPVEVFVLRGDRMPATGWLRRRISLDVAPSTLGTHGTPLAVSPKVLWVMAREGNTFAFSSTRRFSSHQ